MPMITEQLTCDLAQTIVRSRDVCARLADFIAESRSVCGQARRLIHPRIRGASDVVDLAACVRVKIDAGLLPRTLPERIWAGRGSGRVCALCDQPIRPDEVEYEFENGRKLRMHLSCAAVWQKAR